MWQSEYATDLIFKQRIDLHATLRDPHSLATLILTVKPDDIATFLGRKLRGNFQGEAGSRFNVWLLGTLLKHFLGAAALKLYDKFGQSLRIETTTTAVTFSRSGQYREIRHRNGTTEKRCAHMKKILYSRVPLRECLLAANRRYLEFLSEIEPWKWACSV